MARARKKNDRKRSYCNQRPATQLRTRNEAAMSIATTLQRFGDSERVQLQVLSTALVLLGREAAPMALIDATLDEWKRRR